MPQDSYVKKVYTVHSTHNVRVGAIILQFFPNISAAVL